MRVAIEALSGDFGGIHTYVENLVAAWQRSHPDDDLLVVTSQRGKLAVGERAEHVVAIPSPEVLWRPLRLTTTVRRLVRSFGADAVLSTLPATSLLPHDAPHAVVLHDFRHELRPEQFDRRTRLVRRLAYGRAHDVADGFIAVSERTLRDFRRLHPRFAARPARFVHHGADHVAGGPVDHRPVGGALAFAHHTNKRPELVVRAWAQLREDLGGAVPPLTLVGASGGTREHLVALTASLGLEPVVTVSPYLDAATYGRTVSACSVVVFPSDFEGFGLPVLEAMSMGQAVVISPDPALREVAGGHAVVMEDWTVEATAGAVRRALGRGRVEAEAAQRHAEGFTWARAADETRTFLADLVAG